METLFTISLLELFMGGGGRLLEVGPFTVRMILFAVCLCVGLIAAIHNSRLGDGVHLAVGLVVLYLFVHALPLLIGVLKGNDFDIMMLEMQQSLYWLAAPFLALMLSSHGMVLRAAMVARVAGVLMALGYIGVVAALEAGAIDYPSLYVTLNATGEFMFRTGNFFFYKGFLYLGIAAIFFLAMPGRLSVVWSTIVITALAMTLTRGFVLSTSFAALLMLIAQHRWRSLSVALAVVACVAFFIWGYMPSQDEFIAMNREISNNQRIEDLDYIANNITGSLIFGEGFGTLINERLNIENTFLWAFWKLGVVGLLFWLLPLFLSLNYFARISRYSPQFKLACAYLFSTILVYIQTITNPYLNNPIGLSFVLVAIFSLKTLSKVTPVPAHSSYALVPTDERSVP